MPRFIKKPSLIIIVLSIALAASMFYTANSRGRVTNLESFIGQIVAPFQKGLYTISSTVYSFFSEIDERRDMENNYKDVKGLLCPFKSQSLLQYRLAFLFACCSEKRKLIE